MPFGSRRADRVLRYLSVCGLIVLAAAAKAGAAQEPPHPASLDRMIVQQAKRNGVPERLVRRIIMRESKYDPRARNHLYWGLMQISYPTAKSMGFTGTREQLLDPLVNLTYAVPYLANAFVIAGQREEEAVRLYAAGYYFTARQRGLLGALRTANSAPAPGGADTPAPIFTASPDGPKPVTQPNTVFSGPAPAPVQAAAVQPQPDVGVSAAHDPAPVIAMVTDKKTGEMAPPKKWTKDGGMTKIARGDQGVENIAAYAGVAETKGLSRKSAHRSHKSTEFASLDAPASAQAYAAAPAQSNGFFAQAPSQNAIAQATAGQPATVAQADAAQQAQQVAPQPGAAQVANAEPAAQTNDADAPKKKSRRSARKHHGHDDDDGVTKVAKSDTAKPKHSAKKKANDAQPVVAQQADTPAQPTLRQ